MKKKRLKISLFGLGYAGNEEEKKGSQLKEGRSMRKRGGREFLCVGIKAQHGGSVVLGNNQSSGSLDAVVSTEETHKE